VSVLSGVDAHWSAAGFVHLGASLAIGPAGAVVTGAADALGGAVRYRSGVIRLLFNAAVNASSNLGAWALFALAMRGHPGLAIQVTAGLVAGLAQWAINITLIAVVIRLSRPDSSISTFLRQSGAVLPYHLGYGMAAVGGSLLYRSNGAAGFSLLLVPVVLLQGFLTVLERRTSAHEQASRTHAREREALLQRVIEASLVERGRIARELHDGLVQDLALLASGLRTQADRVELGRGTDMVPVLRRAANTAAGAIDELRTLLRRIAPVELEERGLAAVVHDLCAEMVAAGVAVDIDIALQLSTSAAITVFQIIQEGTRNIGKHARATHVTITVHRDGDRIRVLVSDDGRGFTADEATSSQRGGHLGLVLLHDLASQVGGSLHVDSAPSSGTSIRALLPAELDAAVED